LVTSGGTTTGTVYVGTLEEVSTTDSSIDASHFACSSSRACGARQVATTARELGVQSARVV
jgi:hypothetical protein